MVKAYSIKALYVSDVLVNDQLKLVRQLIGGYAASARACDK